MAKWFSFKILNVTYDIEYTFKFLIYNLNHEMNRKCQPIGTAKNFEYHKCPSKYSNLQ